MKCVRIRGGHGNHERATVCYGSWVVHSDDGRERHVGEILIHSTFGSWGFTWGHMGVPLGAFLLDVEPGYVAEKFLGVDAYEFDGDRTLRALRERVLERRRYHELSKDAARALWDWIEDSESELTESDAAFCNCFYEARDDHDLRGVDGEFFEEPWELIRQSLNRSFAGFWRDLWPQFIQHLKEEATQ